MTTSSDTLSQRELNRATLARQFLLERHAMSPFDLVHALVGLQSQTTQSWYLGFWSRIIDFDPEEVSQLMLDRKIARVALMRSTIHLVTAEDCLGLRPLVQSVIERSTSGNWAKYVDGHDQKEIVAAGREVLKEKPLAFSEIGKKLGEKWPGTNEQALAQIVRSGLTLIQVPPRGLWQKSGAAKHTTSEIWFGKLKSKMTLDEMVLRYLAAFGPASVNDIQSWSGVTKLREVVDRLSKQLRVFRNEDGKELFDLPEAPRPDADVPAPVRVMYDYDNLFLSHKDRSRFFVEGASPSSIEIIHGTVMCDGLVVAVWQYKLEKDTAWMTIDLVTRLSKKDTNAVMDEAEKALKFITPKASTHDVRLNS